MINFIKYIKINYLLSKWINNRGNCRYYVKINVLIHKLLEILTCFHKPQISKKQLQNHTDKNYCGESFYQIDYNHENSASLDIKLFTYARGKGIASIALYKR